MEKYCDLHTHSYYSDGTSSPAWLLEEAERIGLSAVALCDHNTVAGLPEFVAAGESSAVEAVPGIEFSVDYNGGELHLLMLFVKAQDYAPITALLEDFRRAKETSTDSLVAALRRAGFPIDYDRLRAQAPDGYINRAHVAAELTRLGITESIQEAFKKYLAPGGGFYTPPKRPEVFETIRFIKRLGGTAVLAHPFLNLSQEELEVFLPRAKAAGLDGMETFYSKFSPDEEVRARDLAKRFGLCESGGSDFHGSNKPDIALGVGRGDLKIPGALLKNLR